MADKVETIVDLAFVWHQHQPSYLDPEKGEFVMPWVRLHATKDYYDMAAWVKRFPTVHQTFNLVPSLIEQLEMYIAGTTTDTYWKLTNKRAADLTDEDKIFILEHFFDVEGATMIHPFPRYAQLWRKRGNSPAAALQKFELQEFLDLQVWFNLAWTDPLFRNDPADPCNALFKKTKGYTEEDKAILLKRHHEIMAAVVPIHKEIQDAGLAEITTTPFYHPILPLLCDSDAAKVCQPDLPLLRPRFSHPEDARIHVAKAVAAYTARFGRKPRGMWPAEGSVSPDVIPIFAGAGIDWIATDEEILARSLKVKLRGFPTGDVDRPSVLYRPYLAESGEHHINMVFRDHRLSDLIGFDYQGMGAQRAVDDFIGRIDRARLQLAGSPHRHLITVILDGENCWAGYPQDGHLFLEELYSRIAAHPGIRAVTVSEHLDAKPEMERITRLFSGSWINANYAIWVGHDEDNRAWQMLQTARTVVEEAERSGRMKKEAAWEAWNEIHIAEGSDWFWWYGDDHHSAHDATFDQLFRSHLMRAYKLAGEEIPAALYRPIASAAQVRTRMLPLSTMTPSIDGRVTHFFEWRPAAVYDPKSDGGAMHRADQAITVLRLGFDTKRLYLCIQRTKDAPPLVNNGSAIRVRFAEPQQKDFIVRQAGEFIEIVSQRDSDEKGCAGSDAGERDILEIGIPWRFVPGKPGQEVRFSVERLAGETVSEVCPAGKMLSFDYPSPNFDAEMWLV